MKRIVAVSALALCGTACAGQQVDLGAQSSSTSGPSSASGAGAAGGVGAGNSGSGAGSSPNAASCTAIDILDADAGADQGMIPWGPEYCDDAPGAPLTTVDAIAQAIVGVWASCFADGIEFTSDGHYFLRQRTPDAKGNETLERIEPVPDGGTYSGPSASGTYAVLDASATLGAGTFVVRMTAPTGQVTNTQIEVFQSPTRIRLFSGSSDPTDYMQPMTFRYQNPPCAVAPGACYDFTSAQDVLDRIVGRWARCTGVGATGLGIEIHSDGTWVALTEDLDGQIVASKRPTEQGTLQVVPAQGSFTLQKSFTSMSPDAGGSIQVVQPALTLSPTTLELGGGILNGVLFYDRYAPLP